MDCCCGIVKYLFGLVNLFIFLGGGGLLGIGIYSLVNDGASFGNLIDSDLLTGTAIILIVAGSLVVFVSFFGCCGAFQESKCMLGTFFCLALLLFAVIAAAAVTGFILGSDAIEEDLEKVLKDSLDDYYSNDAVKDSWDAVQKDFECCGVHGPGDYPNGQPASCESFQKGCYDEIVDFIDENSVLFGAVAIVVALFLLLSMVFSCTIMCSIN